MFFSYHVFVLANSPIRKKSFICTACWDSPYQTILAKWYHIRKNSSREERERGNYFITVSLSLKLKLSRWEGAAALYFGRTHGTARTSKSNPQLSQNTYKSLFHLHSRYRIVASRSTSWLVTPHVTNWIWTQIVTWAPKNKSCLNELKFCEDSRNPKSIRC